jgi:hypothetical protein
MSASSAIELSTGRPWFVWVTGGDGVEHQVADDELAAGMRRDHGIYRGRCGSRVIAAPLIATPTGVCRVCIDRKWQ